MTDDYPAVSLTSSMLHALQYPEFMTGVPSRLASISGTAVSVKILENAVGTRLMPYSLPTLCMRVHTRVIK